VKEQEKNSSPPVETVPADPVGGPELAVLWTTVATEDEARRLASGLLERQLAGCVQVDSNVRSYYRWKGQTQAETEYRVVIKTLATHQQRAMSWIRQNHPYELPQIVVLSVTSATSDYAGWIAEQVLESAGESSAGEGSAGEGQ